MDEGRKIILMMLALIVAAYIVYIVLVSQFEF